MSESQPGAYEFLSSRLRDPISALTHLSAAAVSVLGMAVLLYASRGQPVERFSFLVYGLTLVLMFLASGLYHAVIAGKRASLWLRRLDHTAIYLLIAGTYTPITMHYFSGAWRWGMLAAIWSLALIGIGVKIFVLNAPRWITAGVYLIMGWMAVAGIRELLAVMPAEALFWLIAGGVIYSLGALIYVFKRPDPFPGVFGFHEIWHIFVILGALAHYILILRSVVD